MLENNDSEFFKADIRTTKEGADYILEVMDEVGLEEIVPDCIPISAIQDFIDGKRKNIWEITINGVSVMEVVAPKRVAVSMIQAIKEHGGDSFPMVPIPMNNVLGVAQGKKKNVMSIELIHLAPNAELPGHV
jgi:hypothetical protein